MYFSIHGNPNFEIFFGHSRSGKFFCSRSERPVCHPAYTLPANAGTGRGIGREIILPRWAKNAPHPGRHPLQAAGRRNHDSCETDGAGIFILQGRGNRRGHLHRLCGNGRDAKSHPHHQKFAIPISENPNPLIQRKRQQCFGKTGPGNFGLWRFADFGQLFQIQFFEPFRA